MITPQLERAILQGWATFNIHNHAFSNFGRINIPNNATVIITHVKWYPFLNPITVRENRLTWRDLFKYNEYQLKIDGKKSTNFLQYRNSQDYKFTDGTTINLDDIIGEAGAKNFLYLQKLPIHTDVYFICEEYIKLTITRNAFIDRLTDNTAALNTQTDEQPPQKGLQGIKLLLSEKMQSPSGLTMDYVMGNYNDSNLTAAPSNNTHEANYVQDIDDPYSIFLPPSKTKFPYSANPLIEIGYVTINNNNFNKLKNG